MNYLTKISHLTLSTKNLATSIKFYQGLLKFTLIAEWDKGAYLQSNDVWLCLSFEEDWDSAVKPEYSHIAFNLHPNLFKLLTYSLTQEKVSEWKENTSEGDSLYILDPDNHKLEIHCGDLQDRVQSLLKQPYEGFKLHQMPSPTMPRIVPLYGVHVKLIPLELSHAEGLFNVGAEPKIWEKLPRDAFLSLEECFEWVVESLNRQGDLTFVILNQNDEVIGSTRFLDVDVINKSLEVGYTWLHPSVWRTAANTECKLLLLEYAFEQLNFKRVYFKTDVRNQRSQNAIERLGAQKEGVFRASMRLHEDYWRDSVYYSILDSEWARVKSDLQDKLS